MNINKLKKHLKDEISNCKPVKCNFCNDSGCVADEIHYCGKFWVVERMMHLEEILEYVNKN